MGTVHVTVTSPSGTSATSASDQFTYTAQSVPVVSSLSATSGGTGGGAVFTVAGSGFTLATGVSFGSYPASSFMINSDTQLTAVAPAQPAGTVDVTVTNAAGTSATSSSDHFTYNAAAAPAVTGVSPAAGALAGGNWLLVSGSGFTGATGVTFGSASAPGFDVVSDTSLFAQAPAGSAGAVDVEVTTPSGTSAAVSADHYTFQAAPSVTSINPNRDNTSGGTPVVLTGSHLTGATAVYFGDVASPSFTVTSDTSITATTPAQSSAGSVQVVVIAPGGSSPPVSFLYRQSGGTAGLGPVAVGHGGAHAGEAVTAAHPPVRGNASATPAEGELTDAAAGAITQVLLGNGGPRLVADPNRRPDDPAAVTGRDAAAGRELGAFPERADWGQGPVAVFPPREQTPGRARLFPGLALLDRVFEAGLDQRQDPWSVTDGR